MAQALSPFSPFKDARRGKDTVDNSIPVTRICLVGNLADDDRLIHTASKLGLPVESSETGDDWTFTKDTLFVVEDFDSLPLYFESRHKILGPVAFIQIQEKFGKIPLKLSQPLYTLTLYKKKICLHGFDKTIMAHLKNLINFMGGSVRPTVKDDISYLVIKTAGNEPYEKAMDLGIPTMQDKWVYELWAQRHNIDFCLRDESLNKFTISELSGLKIAFWGYEDNDKIELENLVRGIGASNVEPNDSTCTHLVVNDDEKASLDKIPSVKSSCKIVIPEWLAMCVRMNVPPCETNYIFTEKRNNNKAAGKNILFNALKRKHNISPSTELSPAKAASKSNSSSPDVNKLRPRIFNIKFSKCFSKKNLTADATPSTPLSSRKENQIKNPDSPVTETDGLSTHVEEEDQNIPPEKFEKLRVRRRYKCEELFQTEKNYVEILNTINDVFKVPLDTLLKEKRPILNDRDIKAIFHRFVPILEVHRKILAALEPMVTNWDDNAQIAAVFVKYSDEIIKVYPQYINHLDMIRDLVEEKASNSCEFQKFLKDAESNPRCKRQGLKDLIAWPMQRIGRLILLLQGILDDTPRNHPDNKQLHKAIQLITDCGKQVNEDKRVTEHAIRRLEIFHEIENCPLEILSLKRYFVEKVFVQEICEKDGNLRRMETVLCLFLFKEVLEVCKQRNNYFNLGPTHQKPYKHVAIYPLEIIRRVISVTDQKNKFSILFQPTNGVAWRSIYAIQGEHANVDEIVLNFARLVARCKMENINEIHCKMSMDKVVNYFSQTETTIAPPTSRFFTEIIATCQDTSLFPKSENEGFAVPSSEYPKTPDSVRGQFTSPLKKSNSAKGKLRRAWSTLLTPISTFVGSGSNLQSHRGLGSTSSVNVMMTSPQEPIAPTYTPPMGRRKLKSNSFQSKLNR